MRSKILQFQRRIANLYNFRFDSGKDCQMTINHFNSLMNPKGIYIELLKEAGDFYLIYVYGYPVADVKAFIETNGQNCIICDDWKVY